MISSAKRWAIWRAESSVASSLYCLARTCGYCWFLASKRIAVGDEFAVLNAEVSEGHHRG